MRLFNKTEGFGGYNEIIKQNRRVWRLMRQFNKTEGFGGYNEIIKQNRRVGIKRTVSQNRRV